MVKAAGRPADDGAKGLKPTEPRPMDTERPCPRFSGDTWHHIAWDVERISATQYRYNTLWVDDKAIPINRVFDAEPTDWDDNMGVQWQLDQNGNGDPLHEWVDRVTLTMW